MSGRLRNLNPYELHKHLVNIYSLNAKGSTAVLKRDTSKDRTDFDVIKENHKFLWEEDDVADSWERQLAKKYYDKLFKEYCICDLTRYKENKKITNFSNTASPLQSRGPRLESPTPNTNSNAIGVKIAFEEAHNVLNDYKRNHLIGFSKVRAHLVYNLQLMENLVALRWRVEKEVVLGKGQFQCGNKRCDSDQGLRTWEVNFAYVEDNEKRNALVKLRLCAECSVKLNYKSKKREVKRLKKGQKKKHRVETKEKDSDEIIIEPTEMPPEASTSEAAVENTDQSLWKKGTQEAEEKSREEEFQEYLEELLL